MNGERKGERERKDGKILNYTNKRQAKSFPNLTPTCQKLVTIRTLKHQSKKAPYLIGEIFSVHEESDLSFLKTCRQILL